MDCCLMVLVESEAIAEIRYDKASSTLFVRFVDGDWYRYSEVGEHTYDAFVAAESHGRFFQHEILGRYEYRRL